MQDLLDFSDKTRSRQQQFWQQMCEIPTRADLTCLKQMCDIPTRAGLKCVLMCEIPTRADLKCVLMSQTNVWHTNWSGPEMPVYVKLKQKTLRQNFHSLSASGLFYQPCFFYIFVVQIRTLSWVFWISVTSAFLRRKCSSHFTIWCQERGIMSEFECFLCSCACVFLELVAKWYLKLCQSA